MKKYGVIHHSDNWMLGPHIERFETEKERSRYIKEFRGSDHHKRDLVQEVEFGKRHEATVVDQTQDSILYGFKEEK
jgi:hypothetical protein